MEEWIIEGFEEGVVECKEHAEKFIKKLEKLSKIFGGLAKVEKEHHDNYARALENFSNAKSVHFENSNS